MNIIKTFRIIVGVLLLINTITIFAMLFLEPEPLAVVFNFSFDMEAENLGEAIVGIVGGLVAGIIFFIAMIIVGIINIAIYITFGVLTLSLKRAKAIPIIVTIFTGFALFLGARALYLVSIAEFQTIILPLRVVSDIIVIGLSIANLFLIIRAEKVPRLESTN
jgi:hypothetical protein